MRGRRLAAAVVVALAGLLVQAAGLLAPLDRLTYDFFLRHLRIDISPQVEVIEIDQKSLAALGRWPWRRSVHARLLERLGTLPEAIGMDLHFAEPDREHPGDDQRLLDAVVHGGKVVLPVVLEQDTSDGPLRESLPIRPLALAAAALGHVEVELEADGIARSIYLLAGMDTPRWPTFGLAMMQVAGLWQPGDPLPGARSPVQVARGHWLRDYRLRVPLPRELDAFPHFSYVDVLHGEVPLARFAGKFVLVGAVAAGMGDVLPTPVSRLSRPTSGLHYAASVLNGLLTGQMISELPVWILRLLVVLPALLVLLPMNEGALRPMAAAGLLLVPAVSWAALQWGHQWWPPVVPMAVLLLVLLWSLRLQMQRLLERLRREHGVVRATLDAVDEAVLYLDREGRILQFNEAAERLLAGDGGRRLSGHRLRDLVMIRKGNEEPHLLDLEAVPPRDDRLPSHSFTLITSDARRLPVTLVLSPVPWSEGERLVVISDLSREQALVQALEQRRSHDPLTGLPNRDWLRRRLEAMLRRAESWRGQVAVVHLEVDGFDRLEQLLGSEAGAQLLQEVARRLDAFAGRGVEVGHLARGEFLVLLEGNRPEERLEALHQQFSVPVQVDDRPQPLSVTFGVSRFPEHPVDADELLHLAALALEQGRNGHRGGIVFYQAGMKQRAARRLTLQRLLHGAVDAGRLETVYQPMVGVRDLRVTGVECLMRLQAEDGTPVSPEEFVPLAEKMGLIDELAHHQLYQACLLLEAWHHEGLPPLRLGYNLAARQLQGAAFVERLERLSSVTGFDSELLEFEIAASLLPELDSAATAILQRLRALGAGLVVDDFGGSPRELKLAEKWNFTALKIDRAFVQDLDRRAGSGAFTAAMINMGHGLGMRVIAKGVENATQLETLAAQHCDEVQGFHLGHPMSSESLHEMLQRNGGQVRAGAGTVNMP